MTALATTDDQAPTASVPSDELAPSPPRSKFEGLRPFLTTKEVAGLRGKSHTVAWRAVRSGLVPSIRLSRTNRRVPTSALIRLDGGPEALATFHEQTLERLPDDLTLEMIAGLLRVTKGTVSQLVKHGDIPLSRSRRPHTIAAADLRAFIARGGIK